MTEMSETTVFLVPLDALKNFRLAALERPIVITACAAFLLSEVFALARQNFEPGMYSIVPVPKDAMGFEHFMRWEQEYDTNRIFTEQDPNLLQHSGLLETAEERLVQQMRQLAQETCLVVPRALHEFMTHVYGDRVYQQMLGLDGTVYDISKDGLRFRTGIARH